MAASEPRITIPLRTGAEKREAERFDVSMPVRIENDGGRTRDMSANGLAFETDRAYQPGERLQVVIEYLMDGHDFPLKVEAEVVRCRPEGGRFQVAAKLVSPIAESPYDDVP